ncbi:hypothetical protein MSIMFI_05327 [Mycobacterium simulans]|nr:hypothetical protein MSIMFI_05327 [Mycobacterium simulans]
MVWASGHDNPAERKLSRGDGVAGQSGPVQAEQTAPRSGRNGGGGGVGQRPQIQGADGNYRGPNGISGVHGVGVGTGAGRAHIQMRGRSGIQGDPRQRERHSWAGAVGIGTTEGDQGVQRGVEQGGVDAVAGDVGVGGQNDVGVHGVGIGRVVTQALHPLEPRTVLQAHASQIVVETTHVDGLYHRQG